jgi:hypothetical protein
LDLLFFVGIVTGYFVNSKIIPISFAIIALFASVYRAWLKKHNELQELKLPSIELIVCPKKISNSMYLEIFNTGNEDLELKELRIIWEEGDREHSRVLNEFLPAGVDVIRHPVSRESFIVSKQRLLATNLPNYLEANELKIKMSVMGLSSSLNTEKEFKLQNYNSHWENP